jgi:hypothetical protein
MQINIKYNPSIITQASNKPLNDTIPPPTAVSHMHSLKKWHYAFCWMHNLVDDLW